MIGPFVNARVLGWLFGIVFMLFLLMGALILGSCGKIPQANHDPVIPDNSVIGGNCHVKLVNPEVLSGIKCPLDSQVATGIESLDPAQIRCVKLRVECDK